MPLDEQPATTVAAAIRNIVILIADSKSGLPARRAHALARHSVILLEQRYFLLRFTNFHTAAYGREVQLAATRANAPANRAPSARAHRERPIALQLTAHRAHFDVGIQVASEFEIDIATHRAEAELAGPIRAPHAHAYRTRHTARARDIAG